MPADWCSVLEGWDAQRKLYGLLVSSPAAMPLGAVPLLGGVGLVQTLTSNMGGALSLSSPLPS